MEEPGDDLRNLESAGFGMSITKQREQPVSKNVISELSNSFKNCPLAKLEQSS